MLKTNKIYVITIACLLVLLASTVAATNYMNNSDVWLTVPKSEASYIIGFYNSTHIYAQNATGYGTTANMGYEFLSSNASYVITSAINKLTSGGKIFIKAGLYSGLTGNFLPKSNVTIYGEGRENTILKLAANGNNLFNSNPNVPVRNFILSELTLDGNKAAQSSSTYWLASIYARDCLFSHVRFTNCKGSDLYLYGNGSQYGYENRVENCLFDSTTQVGIKTQSCDENWFVNNWFDNVLNYSIWERTGLSKIIGNVFVFTEKNYPTVAAIESDASYNIIEGNGFDNNGGTAIQLGSGSHCQVLGNNIPSSWGAGIIIRYAYDVIVVNNMISTVSRNTTATYSGIKLEHCSNVTITGNHLIPSPRTTLWKYGIEFSGSSNTAISIRNNFFNLTSPINFGTNPTATIKVENNFGFVTDNAGYQASCVNGTWIPHGLAGTPTSITISIQGTNPYVNATSWYFVPTVLAVNATKFQISFCMNNAGTYKPVGTFNAKTIYWIAVYKP